MKRKAFYVFFAMMSVVSVTSCGQDYDLRNVGVEFTEALRADYPEAGSVEWERNRGWYVAEFMGKDGEMKVWYDKDAQWRMTETDSRHDGSQLPAAVYEAFNSSKYASWKIEDIDKYERPGDVFYLLEIETRSDKERMLFYSESGKLLKDVREKDNVFPDIRF